MNNLDYFSYSFIVDEGGVQRDVPSCSCKDLVISWDISEEQKEQLTSEIYSPLQLCPNITDFKLGRNGKTLVELSSFIVKIQLTPLGLAYNGIHTIFTTDISRDFDPDQYLKDGFEKYISPSDNVIAINSIGSIDVFKWISKKKTNYYSSALLDFSAISVIDGSTVIKDYNEERQEVR